MNWWRFSAAVAVAVGGAFGLYWLATGETPTWAYFVGGIAFPVVAVAWLMLAVLAVNFVVEKVRPRFMFRKPRVILSLAHREAALVGRRRYRHHPVRFWGGMTIANTFFIGCIIFRKPETEDLRDDRDRDGGCAGDGEAGSTAKQHQPGPQSGIAAPLPETHHDRD